MQKKLNICRNWKLQYTKRQCLGDYIQHYLFYGLYPIKQTLFSARIAKLAETFLLKSNKVTRYKVCSCVVRYESFETLHFLKQKFFMSRIFAVIKKNTKIHVLLHFNFMIRSRYIFPIKVKPLNSGYLRVCTEVSAICRCLQFGG